MDSMTPANPVRDWTILETKIAAAKITNFNDKDNDIKAGIQHASFSIVQTHPEVCHLITTKIDSLASLYNLVIAKRRKI
ncbi:hypothetical protein [Allisonella histaminiformans]|uniref:hypothetical protein n=2 Tax=Allisonella TaxID=209879 RepID=UPI002E78E4BE|nr:hypothetical protein [Allisonella histaminiformans]